MTHLIRTRFARALIAGAFLVSLVPAIVIAHAELETSNPADGATVDSPFDGPVVLDFTEPLADGSEADLLGPEGTALATAVVDQPGARMTFEFDVALDPGEYEVRWTGVALDGHVDRGTFEFTVAPAPPTPESTPTPATSATAAPATSAPATAEPSGAPSPSPSPDGTATGTGDVLLPIIVVLVVVGAGAAYLLTRRNRSTQAG